ncbi:glycosyltransferase family 2 protein [Pseudomonas panipatensis]|uniref:Glycosyltransferase, catalytic subunit of cellulose synthase and poly-beta-1,6-N-acetylglucosamine synthase n=1 Tax=Pseudomonas panipatensis TaxID=428992 RepID=A0A1G8IN37_9PSED|nr:glycosyltransferase family 2 protein [Pseudomonas panipatensis]SDI20293.1 Glycosyltransferase, catalytic subunit of cellulose synthase and poly-beta-1,6-N-acetylglucosamine synthase [Pseudomonas panipatensis]SMP73450.1 Glycosyltransferase, catalytic subunit of cellulose synthase and poly-beta-1,6-N-acetylglucosamine synthase [Pseudomonas panipatensis]
MAEILFWSCLLLPAYAYLGYPLGLALLALFSPRRPLPPGAPLSVSVIIAAHNEAPHIAQKLATLLAQDYPAPALEIILASDGSDDATVAIARSLGDPRVQVLDLPRVGKVEALNRAVALARQQVLVFTDADNQWASDTLGKLLAPLADPQVGACGGNMIIPRRGHALSLGDKLYRHYEGWLRRAENRTGCMVSADGALLALRRELFQSIPPEVNDDFFISTCAPLAGRRIVYVEQAQVLDQGVDEAGKQFRRRLRVTVGGLQSLATRRELLNPLRHGWYAIALISHKLIRRLAPVLLLPLLLSNLFLWDAGVFYRLALLGQLLGYAIGIAGLLDRQGRLPKPFHLAGFLLVTLAGMAVGLWQFLRGQRYGLWNPQQNR